MADKNPKPSPKPSLLRQLFEGVSTGVGTMLPLPAKILLRDANMRINEKLSSNLDPYTYGENPSNNGGFVDQLRFLGGAAKKYIKAGVLDIKDPTRAAMEKNPSSQDMLRMDLLNMYASKPQIYGSVSPSPYKPSLAKDKTKTYYQSKLVEGDLLSSMLDEDAINKLSKGIKSKKDLEAALSSIGKKSDAGYQMTMTGLGKATFDFGEDEKGPYISYYDKWDLNPLSGKSSAIGMGKEGDDFVTGLTESLGATPPEVYGRIYFDKKTGKPIDLEAQKVFNKAVSNVKEAKAFNEAQSAGTGKAVSSGFSGLMKKKK
jgi:hypothetical protein